MDEPLLETAHPKAKKLLNEDFYWSPIEETGPFGSDDGSDTFYGFSQWRSTNKTKSPVTYLEKAMKGWGYPYFDWHEMDTTKIKEYISSKVPIDTSGVTSQLPKLMENFKKMAEDAGKKFDEKEFMERMSATSSNNMGANCILGQDNAIISVGFGQFVMEGKIDEDIQTLAITAIKRQLLPILISRWDNKYQQTRTEQLNKMLTVLGEMNK